MPSVIIKDMEMPENCHKCRFCEGEADTDYGVCAICFVSGKHADAFSRPDWCPLRPAPEWISVEERLPEKDTEALIAFTVNGVSFVRMGKRNETAWMYYDGIWTVRPFTDAKIWNITHWVPLPEPPKAET